MKTTIKSIVLLGLLSILSACAEQRFYIAGYTDLILHPNNPKTLVFSADSRGIIQDIRWERLCATADCNVHSAAPSSSTPHYPPACYARWAKECEGKDCRQAWWDTCNKQEFDKIAKDKIKTDTNCTLVRQTFYKPDPPTDITPKPLSIYQCKLADGTSQYFYKYF